MSAPAAPSTPAPAKTGGAPDPAKFRRGLGIAAIAFLGAGALIFLGTTVRPWTWFGSFHGSGSQIVSEVQQSGQCDFANRRLELGSEPVVFNPGARCAYDFTVAEGTIEFNGPDGPMTLEANQPVHINTWTETARAVSGHAVLLYRLRPKAS